MAGHSRSKDGVASLAYARPSTSCFAELKTWMRGSSPRMTECLSAPQLRSQEIQHAPLHPKLGHDPEKWKPVFGKDHAQ
jgi:hypothetical protein